MAAAWLILKLWPWFPLLGPPLWLPDYGLRAHSCSINCAGEGSRKLEVRSWQSDFIFAEIPASQEAKFPCWGSSILEPAKPAIGFQSSFYIGSHSKMASTGVYLRAEMCKTSNCFHGLAGFFLHRMKQFGLCF